MSNGTISDDALEIKIDKWSKGYWTTRRKYLAIYDPLYTVPTRAEVSQFLKATEQSIRAENTQNTNIWDCDQYSRYLLVEAGKHAIKLGLSRKWSLGMVSGFFFWVGGGTEGHTCNWIYTTNGFDLIEPQDFSFHDIEDCVKKSIRLMIV